MRAFDKLESLHLQDTSAPNNTYLLSIKLLCGLTRPAGPFGGCLPTIIKDCASVSTDVPLYYQAQCALALDNDVFTPENEDALSQNSRHHVVKLSQVVATNHEANASADRLGVENGMFVVVLLITEAK